jgi:hypothetical protein
LLVAGVGKPVIQEICYSFGLHPGATLTDLGYCARIEWRLTGTGLSPRSALDREAETKRFSAEDRLPRGLPPLFPVESRWENVTRTSRKAWQRVPRGAAPGPNLSGRDIKLTEKLGIFV